PLPRELPVLHFLQDLLHLPLHAVIHHTRSAGQVTVLGSLADELVHLRQAPFVQEIHDELQLVQTLVVRNLGLIAGFDQGFESLDHELRSAAAQHSLLAEQIGLGLLREGGVEYTAARTADTVSVGECLCVALAGGILEDSDQTRNAAPLLILAANE